MRPSALGKNRGVGGRCRWEEGQTRNAAGRAPTALDGDVGTGLRNQGRQPTKPPIRTRSTREVRLPATPVATRSPRISLFVALVVGVNNESIRSDQTITARDDNWPLLGSGGPRSSAVKDAKATADNHRIASASQDQPRAAVNCALNRERAPLLLSGAATLALGCGLITGQRSSHKPGHCLIYTWDHLWE